MAGLLDGLAGRGYQGLALEVPRQEQAGLAAWTAGRAAAHKGWQVLCFDQDWQRQPTHSWSERDRYMAENLLALRAEHCPGGKIAAVCGNMHSRLEPPAAGSPYWPSCAGWLRQLAPELTVASAAVVFHSGVFYNMGVRPIRQPGAPPAGPEVRPGDGRGHTLALHLPVASAATFLAPPRREGAPWTG